MHSASTIFLSVGMQLEEVVISNEGESTMMKVISTKAVPVVAVMALLLAVAIHAQTAPSGEQKTLTGIVSDTMCGKTHMNKNVSAAECTRQCVKMGNGFALVVGDQVYALKGHSADLDKYAGQKVTLTGTVHGNSLAVDSVTLAQ